MTTTDEDAINPFQDPGTHTNNHPPGIDTLYVGRDATLTLSEDSLIVLDEGLSQPTRRVTCCGLIPQNRSLPTKTIPYFNILWADLSTTTNNEQTITIHHASPIQNYSLFPFTSTKTPANSQSSHRVSFIHYTISQEKYSQNNHAQKWLDRLFSLSYGKAQRQKRIKILINPYGGNKTAEKLYLSEIEPVFAAGRCTLSVEKTKYRGHAVEIAQKLDIDEFDAVACISGDGLPHEVFNGLGKRKDARKALKKIAVAQLPAGTGNAMSHNLNGTAVPSLAALAIVKGIRTPLDLVSVVQGENRMLSFLSQAIGIAAETDLGTEHLRWMGDFRFTWGFLVRLLGKTVYPCDVWLDIEESSKPKIRQRVRDHFAQYHNSESEPEPNHTDPYSNDTLLDTNTTTSTTTSTSQDLPPLTTPPLSHSPPSTWTHIPLPDLGNFYAGKMPFMAKDANFFPAALPSDGCIDLICVSGTISRSSAIKSMIAIGEGKGRFFDMDHCVYRKVKGFRVVPRPWGMGAVSSSSSPSSPLSTDEATTTTRVIEGSENENENEDKIWTWGGYGKGSEGFISIDGESVPFEPFQVEVHERLGCVLSRKGWGYEGPVL